MRWDSGDRDDQPTAPRNSGRTGAVVWRQNGDTAARKWEVLEYGLGIPVGVQAKVEDLPWAR